MRIGTVIGHVSLSRVHPSLTGARWRIVVPMSLADLKTNTTGSAEELVLYDDLGCGQGSIVGFSEGAEAAMPFRPEKKPLDAYACAILEHITIKE